MKHEIDKKRRMDGTKLMWHSDRVSSRFDRGNRVAPIHIDMGIAKFCNVACVFCYGLMQKLKPVFIQREPLLQAMRDAGEIGVKSIGFIGDGEPTCNPHMHEALRVGHDAGIDMAISTNGYLLDTDEKRINVLENCTWMRFCISAGTREGYKKIHQRDYFDKVVENIRRMVYLKEKIGSKCEIGMQAVFVPTLMLEEMVEESRLAAELRVDYFVIKQCSLPDSGETGMAQFDVNMYDDKEVHDALEKCESYSNDVTDIIPKWNVMKRKGEKPYNHCPSISLISEISGNGNWYPCGFMFDEDPKFDKYKFGNIHDKSLKEIWLSDRYWDIIKMMEDEFDTKAMCKGSCRQDDCNIYCDTYRNVPRGKNFI